MFIFLTRVRGENFFIIHVLTFFSPVTRAYFFSSRDTYSFFLESAENFRSYRVTCLLFYLEESCDTCLFLFRVL
jgi:hypothetical protein